METNSSQPSGRFGKRRHFKVRKIAGLAVLGMAGAIVFAFGFGWLVKVLWNWLMPTVFGLTAITFWQAFGLVLLAKILFGSHHGLHTHYRRRGRRGWAGRFNGHFNEDDAACDDEPMPGNGGKWTAFRTYWREEGRAAFEAYLQRMEESKKTGA